MHHLPLNADPAVSIALALAVGMTAQAVARHLRVPGIVVLLAAGLLLGPDGAGLIQPDALGTALQTLVGFAVAVILFEGGLNLSLTRLRHEARSIRQLVTVGALVTAAGGALSARLFLGWNWSLSVLFGTLVIVTGPTVITPLLRRIRLKPSVATVLEAEGVLIDAIGAIAAVVTLEVVLNPPSAAGGYAAGLGELLLRLGFGFVAGLVAGGLLAALLHFKRLVPEGLENTLTLSIVLVLFQLSNRFQPESGLMLATIAGLTVGNIETRALEDLKDFKEQLTVMVIGMLFVLLAADVRLAEIQSLGWPGVLTVLALMLFVRPANIAVGTWGSSLGLREKAFLSWLAPRGIVAAAVASLFAQELSKAGIEGGNELRALVFLVIAGTVVVQGLTGGFVAQLLGVRRPTTAGYAILGANPVGLAIAKTLRDGGEEVVLLDSSVQAVRAAEEENLRVLHGNALAENLLDRAELDSRAGALALTANDEVNLLFARRAREEYSVPKSWIAVRSPRGSVTEKMMQKFDVELLFGSPRRVDLWSLRLGRGQAVVEIWTRDEPWDPPVAGEAPSATDLDPVLLPLAVTRGDRTRPVDADAAYRPGDRLHVAVVEARRDEAERLLGERGWRPVEANA